MKEKEYKEFLILKRSTSQKAECQPKPKESKQKTLFNWSWIALCSFAGEEGLKENEVDKVEAKQESEVVSKEESKKDHDNVVVKFVNFTYP